MGVCTNSCANVSKSDSLGPRTLALAAPHLLDPDPLARPLGNSLPVIGQQYHMEAGKN